MVFEALDAGVIVEGPLGNIATANPAAARILGTELDEVVGGRLERLVGPMVRPDGSPVADDELPGRVAIQSGEPQLNVLLGFDGPHDERRWIEVSARPLSTEGFVFAVVSSIHDVSQRQRADDALRHAERRQRIVLEHAVGGYAIVDPGGRLIDGSDSLLAWMSDDADRRRSIGYDIVHDEDQDEIWSLITRTQSAPGTPRRTEVRVTDGEGHLRWIELIATDRLADPAVGGIVINFNEITERKLAAEALAHQAFHDPVTGLPNRRLLVDRLEAALLASQVSETRLAVLFFDIDHFKLVNDSLGHPAGDAVLQMLSARLQAGSRPGDTVVRFGGDEFVVVCEAVSGRDEALDVAETLCALIEEPLPVGGTERVVTVSAGIALSGGPGETPSSLLRDADAAMNMAKERGRARVEVFTDELRRQATRRLDLDSALRRSLVADELYLLYQPVVTVDDDRPVGCEALLRWHHPEHGSVSPTEFIPLAERSGLILPIGEWVLREALEQLADWHRQAPELADLWIAINVSARQLGSPDLVVAVTDALERTGLEPGALHIEVTESAIVDLATSIDRLAQLKAIGVHIDVDDFGTGYSSLSYLKQLPIDTLKIDRSFMDGLGAESHDTSIVDAIVRLGHALHLGLVAEGVETPTQLAELRRLGCELAQGFHWSRPLAPDELLAWVRRAADPPAGEAVFDRPA
jgi:diguanylate cyclase (GGDEF)-like protein/PAS domain S-box-containing protein